MKGGFRELVDSVIEMVSETGETSGCEPAADMGGQVGPETTSDQESEDTGIPLV